MVTSFSGSSSKTSIIISSISFTLLILCFTKEIMFSLNDGETIWQIFLSSNGSCKILEYSLVSIKKNEVSFFFSFKEVALASENLPKKKWFCISYSERLSWREKGNSLKIYSPIFSWNNDFEWLSFECWYAFIKNKKFSFPILQIPSI